MMHGSTLLSVALAVARRMGLNRDGARFFALSPWQTELRRRLWHHLVLLDAWAVENHGLQPSVVAGGADTCLPQNSPDSAWDSSEFASSCPPVQPGFTDMTLALVQYEIASMTIAILGHPYTSSSTNISVRDYLELHAKLVRQGRQRLDIAYMRSLDEREIIQKLTRDLHDHAFRRMRLMQLAPILNARGLDERERVGLEAK